MLKFIIFRNVAEALVNEVIAMIPALWDGEALVVCAMDYKDLPQETTFMLCKHPATYVRG